MTPSGIEPATFRFIAQHLNHCATTVPDSLTFKRRIKSQLPFAGNIRSSLYSQRFQDRGKLRLFSKSQKNIMKYKKYRKPTRCNNNGLLIIPVSSTCFGQNNCPKHVELTGIINKPSLLHLVGCLYYLYQ